MQMSYFKKNKNRLVPGLDDLLEKKFFERFSYENIKCRNNNGNVRNNSDFVCEKHLYINAVESHVYYSKNANNNGGDMKTKNNENKNNSNMSNQFNRNNHKTLNTNNNTLNTNNNTLNIKNNIIDRDWTVRNHDCPSNLSNCIPQLYQSQLSKIYNLKAIEPGNMFEDFEADNHKKICEVSTPKFVTPSVDLYKACLDSQMTPNNSHLPRVSIQSAPDLNSLLFQHVPTLTYSPPSLFPCIPSIENPISFTTVQFPALPQDNLTLAPTQPSLSTFLSFQNRNETNIKEPTLASFIPSFDSRTSSFELNSKLRNINQSGAPISAEPHPPPSYQSLEKLIILNEYDEKYPLPPLGPPETASNFLPSSTSEIIKENMSKIEENFFQIDKNLSELRKDLLVTKTKKKKKNSKRNKFKYKNTNVNTNKNFDEESLKNENAFNNIQTREKQKEYDSSIFCGSESKLEPSLGSVSYHEETSNFKNDEMIREPEYFVNRAKTDKLENIQKFENCFTFKNILPVKKNSSVVNLKKLLELQKENEKEEMHELRKIDCISSLRQLKNTTFAREDLLTPSSLGDSIRRSVGGNRKHYWKAYDSIEELEKATSKETYDSMLEHKKIYLQDKPNEYVQNKNKEIEELYPGIYMQAEQIENVSRNNASRDSIRLKKKQDRKKRRRNSSNDSFIRKPRYNDAASDDSLFWSGSYTTDCGSNDSFSHFQKDKNRHTSDAPFILPSKHHEDNHCYRKSHACHCRHRRKQPSSRTPICSSSQKTSNKVRFEDHDAGEDSDFNILYDKMTTSHLSCCGSRNSYNKRKISDHSLDDESCSVFEDPKKNRSEFGSSSDRKAFFKRILKRFMNYDKHTEEKSSIIRFLPQPPRNQKPLEELTFNLETNVINPSITGLARPDTMISKTALPPTPLTPALAYSYGQLSLNPSAPSTSILPQPSASPPIPLQPSNSLPIPPQSSAPPPIPPPHFDVFSKDPYPMNGFTYRTPQYSGGSFYPNLLPQNPYESYGNYNNINNNLLGDDNDDDYVSNENNNVEINISNIYKNHEGDTDTDSGDGIKKAKKIIEDNIKENITIKMINKKKNNHCKNNNKKYKFQTKRKNKRYNKRKKKIKTRNKKSSINSTSSSSISSSSSSISSSTSNSTSFSNISNTSLKISLSSISSSSNESINNKHKNNNRKIKREKISINSNVSNGINNNNQPNNNRDDNRTPSSSFKLKNSNDVITKSENDVGFNNNNNKCNKCNAYNKPCEDNYNFSYIKTKKKNIWGLKNPRSFTNKRKIRLSSNTNDTMGIQRNTKNTPNNSNNNAVIYNDLDFKFAPKFFDFHEDFYEDEISVERDRERLSIFDNYTPIDGASNDFLKKHESSSSLKEDSNVSINKNNESKNWSNNAFGFKKEKINTKKDKSDNFDFYSHEKKPETSKNNFKKPLEFSDNSFLNKNLENETEKNCEDNTSRKADKEDKTVDEEVNINMRLSDEVDGFNEVFDNNLLKKKKKGRFLDELKQRFGKYECNVRACGSKGDMDFVPEIVNLNKTDVAQDSEDPSLDSLVTGYMCKGGNLQLGIMGASKLNSNYMMFGTDDSEAKPTGGDLNKNNYCKDDNHHILSKAAIMKKDCEDEEKEDEKMVKEGLSTQRTSNIYQLRGAFSPLFTWEKKETSSHNGVMDHSDTQTDLPSSNDLFQLNKIRLNLGDDPNGSLPADGTFWNHSIMKSLTKKSPEFKKKKPKTDFIKQNILSVRCGNEKKIRNFKKSNYLFQRLPRSCKRVGDLGAVWEHFYTDGLKMFTPKKHLINLKLAMNNDMNLGRVDMRKKLLEIKSNNEILNKKYFPKINYFHQDESHKSLNDKETNYKSFGGKDEIEKKINENLQKSLSGSLELNLSKTSLQISETKSSSYSQLFKKALSSNKIENLEEPINPVKMLSRNFGYNNRCFLKSIEKESQNALFNNLVRTPIETSKNTLSNNQLRNSMETPLQLEASTLTYWKNELEESKNEFYKTKTEQGIMYNEGIKNFNERLVNESIKNVDEILQKVKEGGGSKNSINSIKLSSNKTKRFSMRDRLMSKIFLRSAPINEQTKANASKKSSNKNRGLFTNKKGLKQKAKEKNICSNEIKFSNSEKDQSEKCSVITTNTQQNQISSQNVSKTSSKTLPEKPYDKIIILEKNSILNKITCSSQNQNDVNQPSQNQSLSTHLVDNRPSTEKQDDKIKNLIFMSKPINPHEDIKNLKEEEHYLFLTPLEFPTKPPSTSFGSRTPPIINQVNFPSIPKTANTMPPLSPATPNVSSSGFGKSPFPPLSSLNSMLEYMNNTFLPTQNNISTQMQLPKTPPHPQNNQAQHIPPINQVKAFNGFSLLSPNPSSIPNTPHDKNTSRAPLLSFGLSSSNYPSLVIPNHSPPPSPSKTSPQMSSSNHQPTQSKYEQFFAMPKTLEDMRRVKLPYSSNNTQQDILNKLPCFPFKQGTESLVSRALPITEQTHSKGPDTSTDTVEFFNPKPFNKFAL